MPYKIRKNRLSRTYRVVGENGRVFAYRTTRKKAERQVRLLHSIDRKNSA